MDGIEIIERRPERMFGRDLYIVKHDRIGGHSYVLNVQPGPERGQLISTWTQIEKNVGVLMAPTIYLDDEIVDALADHFQEYHPRTPEPGLLEEKADSLEDARDTRDRLLAMLETVIEGKS